VKPTIREALPLAPGRAASAATLIRRRWSSWRGRAVEPVIREALSLAADDLPWPEASAVGGWWNRAFDPEIDLIGADKALQRGIGQVPGFRHGETALISVSRAGFADTSAYA
jgi:uncharacterized protein